MRRVRKDNEPACLADCRRELQREVREAGRAVASDWDKLGECARNVRAALVRDQDHLCAYCGRRLVRPPQDLEDPARTRVPRHPVPGGDGRPVSRLGNTMKIEHFEARSLVPQRMFDWDNLLGVCSGQFISHGQTIVTCDSARGNRPLHIHPVTHPRDPSELFPVRDGHLRDEHGRPRLGEIDPQGDDALADTVTLNLNADFLVGDRARVIQDLRIHLSKDDSVPAIQRLFKAFTVAGNHGLPPYAHVAAAYLRKKLRARGASPPVTE